MAKAKKGSKISTLITLLLGIFLILTMRDAQTDNTYKNYNLEGEAAIHFIDVGQGSSTLIQKGEEGILIDSGLSEYGDTVTDFIKGAGVKKLKYVIATHPHNDHIGSMVEVMSNFPVGTVIMPFLEEFNTPTTRVYENFIDYLYDNDITVNAATFSDEYTMDGVCLTILGPVEQNKDLNNMSVICKVEMGGGSVMILGDAETEELSSVYERYEYYKNYESDVCFNLKSDILLMGHHGSNTSVYKPFLNEVNASLAVIPVGKDNSYGHPGKNALDYCKNNGIEIYRTDIDGTVSFKFTEDSFEEIK